MYRAGAAHLEVCLFEFELYSRVVQDVKDNKRPFEETIVCVR